MGETKSPRTEQEFQMSHRTLRRYTDEELEFGRRAAPVLTPAVSTVDCRKAVDESFDDPHVRLPDGWEDMTLEQIADWSVVEWARLGNVQKPGVEHGNGCPKGDWVDEPTMNDSPSFMQTDCVCPHDLGDCLPLIPGYNDDNYCHCVVCHTQVEYLEDAGPDRQPGDGWFGGSRPGKPGMYRNDEMAAGRIVYHEGEPVSAEQAVITTHEYPASWDWEPLPPGGPGGRYTARESAVRQAKALAKAKRDVRIFLAS